MTLKLNLCLWIGPLPRVENKLARHPSGAPQEPLGRVIGPIHDAADAPVPVGAIGKLRELAQAAAPSACAARVATELTPTHHQRRQTFDDLCGDSSHTTGKAHSVEPVLGGACPGPTNLENGKRKRRLLPAPHAQPDRVRSRSHKPPGKRLG